MARRGLDDKIKRKDERHFQLQNHDDAT